MIPIILLYTKEIEIIQEEAYKPYDLKYIDLLDGLITRRADVKAFLIILAITLIIIFIIKRKSKHKEKEEIKEKKSKRKLTRNEKLWAIYGKQKKTVIDRIKMKHYEAQNRREKR